MMLSITRLLRDRKLCMLLLFGGMVIGYLKISSRQKENAKIQLPCIETQGIRQISAVTNILQAALEIARNNSFVMVTLINEAYIPFALSWLCNTKHMDIHQHVLFLTTDKETDDMLKNLWPGVKSAVLEGIVSKRNESYSQVGYVKLMVKRTETLMQILKENVTIFLFEVDCLWLRNPVKLFLSHENVDVISTKVSNRDSVIAGGFLYLFPTQRTKELWRELTRRMLVLYDKIRLMPPSKAVSEGDNDQQYLSKLIMKKYKGIRVTFLPPEEFPDGKWYKLDTAKRQSSKPYIINNNWIVGNSGKIKRAKKWKHWFIKEDNSCDEDNIALLNKQ